MTTQQQHEYPPHSSVKAHGNGYPSHLSSSIFSSLDYSLNTRLITSQTLQSTLHILLFTLYTAIVPFPETSTLGIRDSYPLVRPETLNSSRSLLKCSLFRPLMLLSWGSYQTPSDLVSPDSRSTKRSILPAKNGIQMTTKTTTPPMMNHTATPQGAPHQAPQGTHLALQPTAC